MFPKAKGTLGCARLCGYSGTRHVALAAAGGARSNHRARHDTEQRQATGVPPPSEDAFQTQFRAKRLPAPISEFFYLIAALTRCTVAPYSSPFLVASHSRAAVARNPSIQLLKAQQLARDRENPFAQTIGLRVGKSFSALVGEVPGHDRKWSSASW
jgi:hypothetical protein